MIGPSVSASYAKALFDLAIEKGADPEALLAQAGLGADAFENAHARIAFPKFKQLMRSAKKLSREPALALYFGAQISFDQLSLVGLITRAAPTMEDALQQLNRFGRLVIEVEGVDEKGRFQIARREKRLWVDDSRMNPNSFPELTESTLGRFICAFRRFYPDRRYYLSAQVTHAKPSYADLYEELFGIPVEFDCPHNAMEIDKSLLELKLNPKRNYVFGMLRRQADDLLAELKAMQTIRADVESRLIPILHTGEATLANLAVEMGMSEQALYRALRAEDMRFRDVLDELRQRLATDYLRGGKVTVNEAAYLAGFSDPSAFSRAFKRWTGESPSSFVARMK